MALWRIDAVRAELGHRSNASIYTQVREGRFPRPVPIGQRSVGWPDYEVQAIVAARIGGRTDDEIRALVDQLHAQRVQLAPSLLPGAVATAAGVA